MSKKEERAKKIIQILKQRNGMTIRDLSVAFDVSEMTIRRDIEELTDTGIVQNISGAVIYNALNGNSEQGDEYSLLRATTSNVREKRRIGQYAASLIEENDCAIIDNGSTTEYIAAYLDTQTKATIVTCNLNIVNRIYSNPNINLIFGGGYFHADTSMFESQESLALLERIRANKVFVSAAGVHLTLGATCSKHYEIETKKQIIESGAERILIADSSKFSQISPCFFSNLEAFHRIITDDGISDEWKEQIARKKIDLVVV